MPGVVIDGAQVPVPGLTVLNWHDNPKFRLRIGQSSANDGQRRGTRWVRSVVLHTTLGIPGGNDKRPQTILPGLGPAGPVAENVAHFWASTDRCSGAHLICDFDGTWICLADLSAEATYHATTVNDVSIGIEICQGPSRAEIYEGQLDSVVAMVDFLTERFRIQRQIPDRYTGPIPRLASGGADCVGVFGHRDQTDHRGEGDPGNAMMAKLAQAGYERFDFRAGQDLEVWRERQRTIAADMPAPLTADGIPGPQTAARLEALGHASGLWVKGKAAAPGERLRGDLDQLARRYSGELPAPDLRRIVQEWLG